MRYSYEWIKFTYKYMIIILLKHFLNIWNQGPNEIILIVCKLTLKSYEKYQDVDIP